METILFKENFSKLLFLTEYYIKQDLRFGQSLSNALAEIDSRLYVESIGTENDCFYDNGKVCKFLHFIHDAWSK